MCHMHVQQFEVVEFSPEDATRTELDYLDLEVVQTAVDAGATHILIFRIQWVLRLLKSLRHIFESSRLKILNQIVKVVFSVHCHNDLGMAAS